MKTTQTADNTGADNTSKPIDFRKDTPPIDRLAKCVEERYGHLPPADIKTEYDFVEEFIAELNELRCKPGCANGSEAGPSNAGVGANGQLGTSCICSLLNEMTSEEAPLVPKGEFVAVVEAAGYNQEDALAHYRNYAWTKLRNERNEELIRLIQERGNALNWWLELNSNEASAQASAAGDELRSLKRQIEEELEAIMSA